MLNKIQKLIDTNTPFALMQYFTKLRGHKEGVRTYEILKLDSKKDLVATEIECTETIQSLKNHPLGKKVVDKKGGCVYEFNNFKEHFKINASSNAKNSI